MPKHDIENKKSAWLKDMGISTNDIQNALNPREQMDNSSSHAGTGSSDGPEIVVFDDFSSTLYAHKREKRKRHSKELSKSTEPELDILKTKHEIYQFNIDNSFGEAKLDAQTKLAIRLGAKPPKRPYVNYARLQEAQRQRKAEQSNNPLFSLHQPLKLHGSARHKAHYRRRGSSRSARQKMGSIGDAQVGRNVGGIQYLSKRDRKQILTSKK